MAGKTKKKKKSKPGARYNLKRGASAGTKKALAARGPRAQALPGMSKVRDSRLDGFCEDAGEGLDQINAGTAAVADAKQAALQRMRDRKMSSYVHAGVRFTLNEGVDSISVKRLKEKSASGSVSTSTADAGTENDQVGDERRDAVDELGGEDGGAEPGGEAHEVH